MPQLLSGLASNPLVAKAGPDYAGKTSAQLDRSPLQWRETIMSNTTLSKLMRLLTQICIVLAVALAASSAGRAQSAAGLVPTAVAQPAASSLLQHASASRAAEQSGQETSHPHRRWWIVAAATVAIAVVAIIIIRRNRRPACAANGCATGQNTPRGLRTAATARIAATE